jgi:crotonobetainyl-CoA:carnitine CoA-transferase CaiB-like acyl-CoA transferase
MLSPYRVVDLTRGNADLGPMVLADLGAEVVRVEPPGGGDARRAQPLAPSLEPGMQSLRFQAFNRNKRSLTLDLDTPQGRADFLKFVAGSDFLFEDLAPGEMDARGLGFDALRRVNPRLVYVAVTPFGQDGPYASHMATDLTLSAMGGMAALIGEADRPPVRVSVPQAWLHAAAESAVAAMVGHWRRLATGEAQFVDVSVQCAVFWTGLQAMIAHAIQGKDFERSGSALQLGTITLPLVYPCSDGEAVLIANGPTMVPLVRWMAEEGVVPAEWITLEDWPTYDVRVLSGQPTKLTYDEVMAAIARYTSRHSKQELLIRGIEQ